MSMRKQGGAIGLLSGGVALCVILGQGQTPWLVSGGAVGLVWTLAVLMLFAGVLLFFTGRPAHRTPSLFRLDFFLRFLRKRKKHEPPHQPGRLERVLPSGWLSDRDKGRPGRLRRWLKRIGPSVHSSPFRRMVQAACLVTFLWMFFIVCWPYSAQPELPGKVSSGWTVTGFDQAAGTVSLAGGNTEEWLESPRSVFLVEGGANTEAESSAGRVRLQSAAGGELLLEADEGPDAMGLDELLLAAGPWTLHEKQPGGWPSHYADDLAEKELLPADTFLAIDPLVSLSTAVASSSWVWSLASAGMILLVCVLIPRGFCGYLCPLGTLIDLFDWALGRRVERLRVPDDGWWVHIKYYLLVGTLVAGLGGVLVSGFVAAIPVVTRGLLFLGEPLQVGLMRGWHAVPSPGWGQILSIGLFLVVLGLGFLRPRFWCTYVCPSGAVFSLGNLFRVSERKVESSCINCNKCVEICPFDAIKPDFTTRTSDCTLCQSCGGVCPTDAIKFVDRWNRVELKVLDDPPTGETRLGRRGFLSLAAGTAAALAGGAVTSVGLNSPGAQGALPVRPPGSVPEEQFLQMCIRCGECFKVCPNNVLQPMGLGDGLSQLWTPEVVADWAGCESSCNACGQVCPTGAIRSLSMDEKQVARMGLAIVNESTCLPYADRGPCQLCVDECVAAGYDAIEFLQVGTEVDEEGRPIEGTGELAPVVIPELCVGCGLCQTRCFNINVKDEGLLSESAIIIEAGEGREDRLMEGSYVEARRAREEAEL